MAKGLGRGRIGRQVVVQGAPIDEEVWKPTRKGMRPDENHIDVGDGMRVSSPCGGTDRSYRTSSWCYSSSEVEVHRYHQGGCATAKSMHITTVRTGPKSGVIRDVKTPADLRIGFDKAHDLIFVRWKNCLRRWERGH